MVKFLQKLGKLVEEGKLVPNKVKKMGGLEKVEEGLKYMTSGQVRSLPALIQRGEGRVLMLWSCAGIC